MKRNSSLLTKTSLKKTKIKARGKQTDDYEDWKHNVAIPHLKATSVYTCANGCGASWKLDVGHIKPRSTHPHLKKELTNVRWECIPLNRFGACQ